MGGTDKSGLGGFVGTVRSGSHEAVLEVVGRYLGLVETREYGSRWYEEAASVGLNGSVVQWSQRTGQPGALVEVKQTDCDELGLDRSLALLAELVGLGLRATRLDTYADRSDSPRPSLVYDDWEAGRKVSRSRRASMHSESGRRAEKMTVGSRQSESYLRVYEDASHGPGARWELEAKGTAAQAVVARLLRGEGIADVHWSMVVRLVDFRDRAAAAHGERAERSSWFAALVDRVVVAVVAQPARVDHLAKRAAWLVRQVLPTLATVWTGYGDDWLREALSDGLDRLRPRDLAVLRAAV